MIPHPTRPHPQSVPDQIGGRGRSQRGKTWDTVRGRVGYCLWRPVGPIGCCRKQNSIPIHSTRNDLPYKNWPQSLTLFPCFFVRWCAVSWVTLERLVLQWEQSLAKGADRFGWTMCTVRGRKMPLISAPSMAGETITVATMRTQAYSVKVGGAVNLNSAYLYVVTFCTKYVFKNW